MKLQLTRTIRLASQSSHGSSWIMGHYLLLRGDHSVTISKVILIHGYMTEYQGTREKLGQTNLLHISLPAYHRAYMFTMLPGTSRF